VFAPDDKGHSVALVEHLRPELLDQAQLAVANRHESAVKFVH
jgi:hypothetical protein